MKNALAFLLVLAALPAQAACYADYKAKQDGPLRLHYGVAEIHGACSRDNATAELTGRLANAGWVLLNVLELFDESGLEARRGSAADFYLRF